MSSGTTQYLPWIADACLPGESIYGLLNKLGWLAGKGPLRLLRELRICEENPRPSGPVRLDYTTYATEWYRLGIRPASPTVRAVLESYIDKTRFDRLKDLHPRAWDTHYLRFCEDCMSMGIHFSICQLHLVELCPFHLRNLTSNCPNCGSRIDFKSERNGAAFSCEKCEYSLLDKDVTDIFADRRLRWKIAQAYEKLTSSMERIAPISCLHMGGVGRQGPFPVSKQVVTATLYPERQVALEEASMLRCSAIRVTAFEMGRPRIEQLSLPALPEVSPHNDSQTATTIHQLAQLRVGSWMLLKYPEHLACMVAAQERLRHRTRQQFNPFERTVHCCIGEGFAAWESDRIQRIDEKLPYDLWKEWGLETVTQRSFASYVIEKSHLTSIVSAFLRNDGIELVRWHARGSFFGFEAWERTSDASRVPAIAWIDLRKMNFSASCSVSGLCSRERWRWLIGEFDKFSLLPQITESRVEQKIQMLRREYSANARQILAIPILNSAMNLQGAV